MSKKSFYGYEANILNCSKVWRGSIRVPWDNKTTYDLRHDNRKYLLHETTRRDINNRTIYIVLLEDTNITYEIRRKYNLTYSV